MHATQHTSCLSASSSIAPFKSTHALKKPELWPRPNYRKLIASGHSSSSVRLFRFLYDWVPTKPLAKLPHPQEYYESAVRLFAASSEQWLDANRSMGTLSISSFSHALAKVLSAAWGYSPNDSAYFTARHERSVRGCELHVLLGDKTPFAKCPTHRMFDRISRELSLGWPAPRPPHEKKGVFVVPRVDVSIDAQGSMLRARWCNSSSSDKGSLAVFSDDADARDWFSSLPEYLLITDRPTQRLLSSHDTRDEASSRAATFVAQRTHASHTP